MHKNRNIQLELEKIEADSSSTKALTAVFRVFILNIVILSICTRPSVHALLKNSMTKDFPGILPFMALINIPSISLSIMSYKNMNQEDFFSASTFVKIVAIMAALIPNCFLTMLLSMDRPTLIVAPLLSTGLLTFSVNQASNTIFQSHSLAERISYSLISSTVPLTIRKNPGNDLQSGETTLHQGLLSIGLNILELCAVTAGILIQTMIDTSYGDNLDNLVKKTFGISMNNSIILSFISFSFSCACIAIYYWKCHPRKSYVYDKKLSLKLTKSTEDT